MLDKIGQEITIGCKVVVVGGQGELQRMIVEKIVEPRSKYGRGVIKCRPTEEDSCAKVKKLKDKYPHESIVIDKLVEMLGENYVSN